MSDRLTQLQVCVDQLVEQFNAAVNYVNLKSEGALLDDDEKSVINRAANAPIPGQQPQADQAGQTDQLTTEQPSARNTGVNSRADTGAEASFDNTVNELSTDMILKSRQISMLIDSLPGAGISEDSQLQMIKELAQELDEVENQRVLKIKEKDEYLKWCEGLIMEVASGISRTRT